MRILALETSQRGGSVAVADGARLVAEERLNADRRSAQSLAPAIRATLDVAGWSIRDIELIGVTIGPGSFTGLRVGVATAKALAYALAARCVGLNTLEVIAAQAPCTFARLSVAIDAQRGQVFAAMFERSQLTIIGPRMKASLPGGSNVAISPSAMPASGTAPGNGLAIWRMTAGPSVLDNNEWLGSLDSTIAATGPGLGSLMNQLPHGVTIIDAEQWTPRAATVAALAWRRHLTGAYDDVWKLSPLYLRKSAAEEKRERSGQQGP